MTLPTLLAEVRPMADFIVMDSQPCRGSSDAFFLAPLADAILYVVRRRKQDVEEQRSIQHRCAGIGGKVLGAVYNEGPRFHPFPSNHAQVRS